LSERVVEHKKATNHQPKHLDIITSATTENRCLKLISNSLHKNATKHAL